jgi:hypothetical protein
MLPSLIHRQVGFGLAREEERRREKKGRRTTCRRVDNQKGTISLMLHLYN